jgi:hypothetical protein
MLVRPAEGLKVRDPRTRAWIPAEGIEVPAGDREFALLIAAGDVVPAAPQEAPVIPGLDPGTSRKAAAKPAAAPDSGA